MEKGAEVFKNVCCTGVVDMVLRINGQYIPIDVKQKTWQPKINAFGAAHGATSNGSVVWFVAVDPSTRKVTWYRQKGGSPHPRPWNCPKGLETFWDD